MKAQPATVFLLLFLIFAAAVGGDARKRSQRQVTSLQFYMHDIVTSRQPTAVIVVRPTSQDVAFGDVTVMDDLLTEGPSHSSKPVGRGQGTYIQCALQDFRLLLTFTAVLQTAEYKGSISFHGSDAASLPTREIAVIGGTGDFRMARGYATIQTQSSKGLNAILLFNVSLLY